MYKILFLSIFIFHDSFAQVQLNKNLDSLFKEYKELPLRGKGMSKEEINYSEAIRTFKEKAIPKLIKMLNDNELEIRERASFALKKIDGLNETHLDDLIIALGRGQTWHAAGIASIGSKKAITALTKQLYNVRGCGNQIAYAFECLEEKGLSSLINLLKCQESCDKIPYRVISCIFDKLGKKSVSKINELSEIAFSENYSIQSRQCAINCLGSIQQNNLKLETDLNNLAYSDSINFYKSSFFALTKIKSDYAVTKFNRDLKNTKDEFKRKILLRNIAKFGIKAVSTGGNIIPYLKSDNWETRVASINTLGHINYISALKHIENALKNEYDLRLNYVAINALARMKIKSLVPALTEVSLNHWYPEIRKKAKVAINIIENDNSIKTSISQGTNFHIDYFSYGNIGKNVKTKIDSDYNNFQNLKIDSGIFIGTNRGEFGGKLTYTPKGEKETIILKTNICSIHEINDHIIIITGLAHITTNTGAVYLLKKDDKNNFIPQKIIQLPGAPLKSKKIENRILIQTYKGIIELSSDFKIKLIE